MSLHLSPGWQKWLACPKCHRPFGSVTLDTTRQSADRGLLCPSCSIAYRVKNGIANFGVADSFYDEHGFTSTGRDFSANWFGRLSLYYARHHYLYEVSQAVTPGSAVIEIGCGGGSRYFASHYDMLGVEISTSSVPYAARTYAAVVQATASELPVVDGCADAIVSSFVLEHLGDDIVERCLAEMFRVLRPGGMMVHYFDLDTVGPFFGWAKQQPWYQDIFVTSRGHFGLQGLEEWIILFDKAGFEVRRKRFSCKTWMQDFSIWAALDNPLVKGVPRQLGKVAAWIRRTTNWVNDIMITIIDDCLEHWLPNRWASKVIMVLQKR